MIVLDASALLALLYREPGHEMVAAHLAACCMSTVNLAEVVGRFLRDGDVNQQIWQQLRNSPIEFVPFSADQAAASAGLVPSTQPLGLSLGDRVCLALAMQRSLPVLTADRVWLQVSVNLTIQTIR